MEWALLERGGENGDRVGMFGLWGCLGDFGVSQDGPRTAQGIFGLPRKVLKLFLAIPELLWGYWGFQESPGDALGHPGASQVILGLPRRVLGLPRGFWGFPGGC